MIMMENYLCMIFFNSDDEIVFKQGENYMMKKIF